MNELQQAIYTKIHNWTEYAYGIGTHLVSEHYYYSWLLKSGLTETIDLDTIRRELRTMVDSGMIRARTVRLEVKNEATLYDADTSGQTATILSLPEADLNKIIEKSKPQKTKHK